MNFTTITARRTWHAESTGLVQARNMCACGVVTQKSWPAVLSVNTASIDHSHTGSKIPETVS